MVSAAGSAFFLVAGLYSASYPRFSSHLYRYCTMPLSATSAEFTYSGIFASICSGSMRSLQIRCMKLSYACCLDPRLCFGYASHNFSNDSSTRARAVRIYFLLLCFSSLLYKGDIFVTTPLSFLSPPPCVCWADFQSSESVILRSFCFLSSVIMSRFMYPQFSNNASARCSVLSQQKPSAPRI